MPRATPVHKVQLTDLLRESLKAEGLDPDLLAQDFAEWKALGDKGEYSSYYFGKDSDYTRPTRLKKSVLRHVHLPPASDPKEIASWEKVWSKKGRKTSDTSLVYARDPTHGYLLIYIAREPEGHLFAEMTTPQSKQMMENFADVAEAFIHDGTVRI